MNSKINFSWIDSDNKLANAYQQLQNATIIALDTEFIRIRSFYPKLGLIQLFDGEQVYLIDPLAISDFSPFIELLKNPSILKVLHACGEDLDVFCHYFKQLPEPMVDTQIMSLFIGLGSSIGFSKLVEQYCQVKLDKSSSRTDWLARPLTDKQLQYAASDVRFLLPVYQQLHHELIKTPWENAVKQECQALKNKRLEVFDINKAYTKIGNAWQLNPQELSVLQVLEKWRFTEAQKRDLALNFVVKEQALWKIAKTQPKHTACLLEFMHPNEVRLHGKKLILLVEQAQQLTVAQYPKPIKRLIEEPDYKRDLHFLKQQLSALTPQLNGLSIETFATKRQLEQLFKWQKQGMPEDKLPILLTGWRKPFGEKLLQQYQIFLAENSHNVDYVKFKTS